MARRPAASTWARLMGRSLSTLTRQALRAGAKAARKTAKLAAKPGASRLIKQIAPSAAKRAASAAAKKRALAAPGQRAKPAARKALLSTPGRAPVRALAPAQASARPLHGGANPVGWRWGVARLAAGARRYALYQPAGLPPGERLPLVVMLHGCTQDAEGFARSTGMNRLADRERCLVLYPEQDRLANPQACWNWYDTRHGRAQTECALILRAIDQVARRHPVDLARVVVAGLSAGAGTAALLASQHPGRFAAVVMHSGIAPGTADTTLTALRAMQGRRQTAPLPAVAPGGTWPPLLVIQGLADAVVSPRNGRAAAQAWAAAVGAQAGAPRPVQRGQRHAMSLTDFKHRGRLAATLAEVAQLGHAWSGGAAGQPFSDPAGPDACRLLWAFAARQFRAAQPASATLSAANPSVA